jgi:F-type H+-transporting ATPase subunit b
MFSPKVLLLAPLLLIVPRPAFAQGPLLTVHPGLVFWTVLIFGALMFILSRYAFGPLTAAVREREKALTDAIEQAKRDRDEAVALLAEQRKQLDAARSEADKLILEGRSAGEKLRAIMLEETRQQQQEMLDRARREIENEKVRAIAELRREAVDLALAGASKVIERNLDDAGNRKLVETFLASLNTQAGAGR